MWEDNKIETIKGDSLKDETVGYKGKVEMDAGFYNAPYVPVLEVPFNEKLVQAGSTPGKLTFALSFCRSSERLFLVWSHKSWLVFSQ